MYIYTFKDKIFLFGKDILYPKIIKNSNVVKIPKLIFSDKNINIILKPSLYTTKTNITPLLRKPRKNKNQKEKPFKFIDLYEEFVSDALLADFHLNVYAEKTVKELDHINLVLKKMRVEPRLFLYYCFENSADVLIPSPQRMTYFLKDFNLNYRPNNFLYIEKIDTIVDLGMSYLQNTPKEELNMKQLAPILLCFKDDVIKAMWNKKILYDDIKYWKRVLVCFFILNRYNKLREKIVSLGWKSFIDGLK